MLCGYVVVCAVLEWCVVLCGGVCGVGVVRSVVWWCVRCWNGVQVCCMVLCVGLCNRVFGVEGLVASCCV